MRLCICGLSRIQQKSTIHVLMRWVLRPELAIETVKKLPLPMIYVATLTQLFW